MESPRIRYQRMFATGKVVNIGCGDVPVDFGPDTVQVDFDKYTYPNFVQCDAHDLPFKDDEFDTAVLGDVLEHSPDPTKMLREAARVAKRVVATIFEEWRHEGLTIEEKIQAGNDELKKMGYATMEQQYDNIPSFKGKIAEIRDDSEVPHHYHIQNFTDASLLKHIDDAELEIQILFKFPEGVHEGRTFYNWVFVGHKKGQILA